MILRWTATLFQILALLPCHLFTIPSFLERHYRSDASALALLILQAQRPDRITNSFIGSRRPSDASSAASLGSEGNVATKSIMTFDALSKFVQEFDQELASKGIAGLSRLRPLELPRGKKNIAWEELERLSHFIKFASAAYSPALLLASLYPMVPDMMPPLLGSAQDWFQILQLQLPSGVELVHVEPASTWLRPAYFVAFDSKRQCVVLSIRGTASVQDVLTDLAALEVTTPWGPSHKGMHDAAKTVVREICPKVEEILEHRHLTKVVVVGHSLGGSVATYTALLLEEALRKRFASNVSVSCYSFGGPGVALRDKAASPGSGNVSIVSVVNSYDVIPRTSYGHWVDLFRRGRDEVDAMVKPIEALFGLLANQRSTIPRVTSPKPRPVKLYPCGQIIHLLPDQGAVYGTQDDLEDYGFAPEGEDNVHWFGAYEDALRAAKNRFKIR